MAESITIKLPGGRDDLQRLQHSPLVNGVEGIRWDDPSQVLVTGREIKLIGLSPQQLHQLAINFQELVQGAGDQPPRPSGQAQTAYIIDTNRRLFDGQDEAIITEQDYDFLVRSFASLEVGSYFALPFLTALGNNEQQALSNAKLFDLTKSLTAHFENGQTFWSDQKGRRYTREDVVEGSTEPYYRYQIHDGNKVIELIQNQRGLLVTADNKQYIQERLRENLSNIATEFHYWDADNQIYDLKQGRLTLSQDFFYVLPYARYAKQFQGYLTPVEVPIVAQKEPSPFDQIVQTYTGLTGAWSTYKSSPANLPKSPPLPPAHIPAISGEELQAEAALYKDMPVLGEGSYNPYAYTFVYLLIDANGNVIEEEREEKPNALYLRHANEHPPLTDTEHKKINEHIERYQNMGTFRNKPMSAVIFGLQDTIYANEQGNIRITGRRAIPVILVPKALQTCLPHRHNRDTGYLPLRDRIGLLHSLTDRLENRVALPADAVNYVTTTYGLYGSEDDSKSYKACTVPAEGKPGWVELYLQADDINSNKAVEAVNSAIDYINQGEIPDSEKDPLTHAAYQLLLKFSDLDEREDIIEAIRDHKIDVDKWIEGLNDKPFWDKHTTLTFILIIIFTLSIQPVRQWMRVRSRTVRRLDLEEVRDQEQERLRQQARDEEGELDTTPYTRVLTDLENARRIPRRHVDRDLYDWVMARLGIEDGINSVLLHAVAGRGKTEFADQLARLWALGDDESGIEARPDLELVKVSIEQMVAGAQWRGVFERRIRGTFLALIGHNEVRTLAQEFFREGGEPNWAALDALEAKLTGIAEGTSPEAEAARRGVEEIQAVRNMRQLLDNEDPPRESLKAVQRFVTSRARQGEDRQALTQALELLDLYNRSQGSESAASEARTKLWSRLRQGMDDDQSDLRDDLTRELERAINAEFARVGGIGTTRVALLDEAGGLRGAGASAESNLDAVHILLEFLDRGKIPVIALTTTDEYNRDLRTHPAFRRRFHVREIPLLTDDETLAILRSRRPEYQRRYHVSFEDNVLRQIIAWSNRYSDVAQPAAAVGVMDVLASTARMRNVQEITIQFAFETYLRPILQDQVIEALSRLRIAEAEELWILEGRADRVDWEFPDRAEIQAQVREEVGRLNLTCDASGVPMVTSNEGGRPQRLDHYLEATATQATQAEGQVRALRGTEEVPATSPFTPPTTRERRGRPEFRELIAEIKILDEQIAHLDEGEVREAQAVPVSHEEGPAIDSSSTVADSSSPVILSLSKDQTTCRAEADFVDALESSDDELSKKSGETNEAYVARLKQIRDNRQAVVERHNKAVKDIRTALVELFRFQAEVVVLETLVVEGRHVTFDVEDIRAWVETLDLRESHVLEEIVGRLQRELRIPGIRPGQDLEEYLETLRGRLLEQHQEIEQNNRARLDQLMERLVQAEVERLIDPKTGLLRENREVKRYNRSRKQIVQVPVEDVDRGSSIVDRRGAVPAPTEVQITFRSRDERAFLGDTSGVPSPLAGEGQGEGRQTTDDRRPTTKEVHYAEVNLSQVPAEVIALARENVLRDRRFDSTRPSNTQYAVVLPTADGRNLVFSSQILKLLDRYEINPQGKTVEQIWTEVSDRIRGDHLYNGVMGPMVEDVDRGDVGAPLAAPSTAHHEAALLVRFSEVIDSNSPLSPGGRGLGRGGPEEGDVRHGYFDLPEGVELRENTGRLKTSELEWILLDEIKEKMGKGESHRSPVILYQKIHAIFAADVLGKYDALKEEFNAAEALADQMIERMPGLQSHRAEIIVNAWQQRIRLNAEDPTQDRTMADYVPHVVLEIQKREGEARKRRVERRIIIDRRELEERGKKGLLRGRGL